MSTLHKVKAYFGMAPMEDYDDEYYDDRAPSRGFPRAALRRRVRPLRRARLRRPARRAAATTRRRAATAAATAEEPRYSVQPREFDRPDMSRPRFGSWLRGSTRGALAMDPRRMAMMFEEGQPAVEDHHAAAQGLQRGPHHRRAVPRRHPGHHGPGVDGQRRRQAAGRLRGRLGVRVARLVRQGRDQGVPAVARRRRRVTRKSVAGSPKPASTLTNRHAARRASRSGCRGWRCGPAEMCARAESVRWRLPRIACGDSDISSVRSGSRWCCSFRSLGLRCSSSGCC